MSKKSEAVKRWRKATKRRMVEAMGGCCQCCGYNKCDEAMEFHHLDPSGKDFGFGGSRANPISWDKIVMELKKCILLCSNCHKEVHYNNLKIPDNYTSFNELYTDYKHIKKHIDKVKKIQPPLKNVFNKRQKTKIRWDLIDLESLLKRFDYNLTHTGEFLNISDNAVRKRAKKLNIDFKK